MARGNKLVFMEITGLDLGVNQIKYVTIKKESKELVSFGIFPAPKIPLISDSEEDASSFAKFLKTALESQNLVSPTVYCGLPEGKVFSRILTLPKMSEKELSGVVSFEAEQYLPISLKDATYDFSVIGDLPDGKQQEILLVAASKLLVDKYIQVISKAGLNLVGLEPESVALLRSVVDTSPSPMATLVVNFGEESTDLVLVYGGVVRFTRSIGTGGAALTKILSQNLGFELAQAEEYKKTYGLDETQLEGKVASTLKPVFELIVEEIRRALAYHQTHEAKSPALKRLVLCGGNALMPGVLVYLASALNLESQLGNPWLKIKNNGRFSARDLENVGPLYAVAAGLALKGI